MTQSSFYESTRLKQYIYAKHNYIIKLKKNSYANNALAYFNRNIALKSGSLLHI